MFNLLPFVIIIISFVVIVGIIVRRFPVISTLDVDSIPQERDAKVKKKIMNDRMIRILKSQFAGIGKATIRLGKNIANVSDKAKKSLKKLEKKYENEHIEKMQEKIEVAEFRGEEVTEKQVEKVENKITDLLDDAKLAFKKDNVKDAEQIYIQVITLEPKNTVAYKGLAKVYVEQKEWKLAFDTLVHLLKLDGKDDEVYFELGEISLELDEPKRSWKYLSKALDINANNPKYLDTAIDVCFRLGRKYEATVCLGKLAEVNPNNKKIIAYQERLKSM